MALAPQIKGWCPGAHRPMESGDGWVFRVRPVLARLGADQALTLCDIAQHYGNGLIDLTNRANLQIRGVALKDHGAVLTGLESAGLLDADPTLETRRNIIVTPFWTEGDQTCRLTTALIAALHRLPDLPAKFGFAVDTGPAPLLQAAAADLRLERGETGLILRADDATKGRPVTEDTAIDACVEMAEWFMAHRTHNARRMAATVTQTPPEWTTHAPLPPADQPRLGPVPQGALVGAGFGQIDASALADHAQSGTAIRVTPWRMLLLEQSDMPKTGNFLTDPDDPLLTVDACPGAPYCNVASVETRDLARALAPHHTGTLHVSGCAKGCARNRPATTVLVGNDGRFDLVKNGRACDAPETFGLTPDALKERIDAI